MARVTVETVHKGLRAGRAMIGTDKRVHLVAQGWLDAAKRTEWSLAVVAACGARGRVTAVRNLGGDVCPSCVDVSP